MRIDSLFVKGTDISHLAALTLPPTLPFAQRKISTKLAHVSCVLMGRYVGTLVLTEIEIREPKVGDRALLQLPVGFGKITKVMIQKINQSA